MEEEVVNSRRAPEFLSKLERIRFDAIAESRTVRDAAQKLGLNPGTLYNWLSDEKTRLQKERGHINACLGQARRSPLLKKELSIRKAITLPVENVEEVDEFDEQENPKD
jgi:hypothetical protein